MKKILKIDKIISNIEYVGIDSVGKSHTIVTDKRLRKNQSILVKEGIVIGVIQTTTPDVYEV